MSTISKTYNINLANYFAGKSLYLDEPTQKKPNIRKLVEQPWQQTKGEMWEEVTETLCNLDFIQAKAAAKMTYKLVKDINAVLLEIPDNAENIRIENERQDRMDKYAIDLVAYAKGEITELEIPETVPLWSKEKIKAEIECIKTNPTRLDHLNDFNNFLGQEADNLQNYSIEFPYFARQQAWNYAIGGPVSCIAGNTSLNIKNKILRRNELTCPVWNPRPLAIRALNKHTDSVLAIAVTPDGKRAISGSWDSTCIIWDLEIGEAINTLQGNSGMVKAIAITPDGKNAISSGYQNRNGKCIIWNLNTGQVVNTLNVQSLSVEAVAITSDGKKALIGDDTAITIWDLDTGKNYDRLLGHTQQVNAIAITPDSKWAISGSGNFSGTGDNQCIFWDLKTKHAIHIFQEHSHQVTSVAITPDGKRSISGSVDKTCFVLDLKSGQSIKTLKGHTEEVTSVGITADGTRAISGSVDKTCIIWDLNTGNPIKILKGHTDAVTSVAITPDGRRAISGSGDNTCIIWNLNTGHEIDVKKWHTGGVFSIALSSDGRKAVSSSEEDGFCVSWDLSSGQVINILKGKSNLVMEVAITPDGKKAVSSDTYNKTCIVWDLITGKANHILKGHTGWVHFVKITSDGNRAISGSEDTTCIIWDLNTGKMVNSLKGHADAVFAIAITPDGKKAISGSESDHCFIWDMTTGQIIASLKKYTEENINAVEIMPDGKRKRSISLIEGYGQSRYPLTNAYSFEITPDGKRAISTCNNHSCGIWDMNSGKKTNTLLGYAKITVVAISPDGRKAVTGSFDYNCIVWDLKTGNEIKTLKGHTAPVCTITITPDGKRVISGSSDNICFIWDLEIGEKVGIFNATSPIQIVKNFQIGIIVGDRDGNVIILNTNKELLCPFTCIATIKRIWDFNLHQYLYFSADCPLCGHRFEPAISILETIEKITTQAGLKTEQSPCLELPDESWNNPELLGECPECHENLKFNPFFGSDLRENVNYLDEIELHCSKVFNDAENAFNQGTWKTAYNLYLKLVKQGMYDINKVYYNMAICQLNRLKKNRRKIILDINYLISLLSSKGATKKAQDISEKLNERLESIKPWWKKLFKKG